MQEKKRKQTGWRKKLRDEEMSGGRVVAAVLECRSLYILNTCVWYTLCVMGLLSINTHTHTHSDIALY